MILGLSSAARAQDPSSWACDAATMADGKRCIFDADATEAVGSPDAVAKQNVKLAKAAGDAACLEASRVKGKVDAQSLKLCKKSIEGALESCTLNGKASVTDAKGRFTEEGHDCYTRLSGVVSSTRTVAALAPDCCACLTQNKCAPSADACYAQILQGRTDDKWQDCMKGTCGATCSDYVRPEPTKGPVLPALPPLPPLRR